MGEALQFARSVKSSGKKFKVLLPLSSRLPSLEKDNWQESLHCSFSSDLLRCIEYVKINDCLQEDTFTKGCLHCLLSVCISYLQSLLISLSKDNYTLNVTRNDAAIQQSVISTFSMKYVSYADENLSAPFHLESDLQLI